MFGSTPSNLAVAMLARPGTEVIAGLNLPMLVKLGKIRSHSTLCECIDIAETVGRKYIAAASRLPEACLGGAACCRSGDMVVRGPSQDAPDPSTRRHAAVLAG